MNSPIVVGTSSRPQEYAISRMIALVWFRRDLRLADNPALHAAVVSGAVVVPVFIWAPEEEAPWSPGAASQWWLHQSLGALAASLSEQGSRLTIRRGPSLEVLLKLAEETRATSVFWNRLYSPAEMARDRDTAAALQKRGLSVSTFAGALLREPEEVRNTSGKPFQVFTPFYKTYLPAEFSKPVGKPQQMAAPEAWPSSLAVSDLALEPKIDWAEGLRESWEPGERGARRHTADFLDGGMSQYSTERDRPDRTGTSRLSPHLHFGEMSPRQLWHAVRRRPAHPDAESYLRQIVWREFAHHLLFHFPETPSQPLRPEFRRFPWRHDPAAFRAWTRGRTGYPLVDAGMRELWHTGWMHNRVRLVAASFLVKHLLIPWQEGAAWFWDTLVDADLANNTLGWQWVAGCGADAAPYFRIFNPTLQAEKFDPEGAYVRRWVPEFGQASYPRPIVAHAAARQRALDALAAIQSR